MIDRFYSAVNTEIIMTWTSKTFRLDEAENNVGVIKMLLKPSPESSKELGLTLRHGPGGYELNPKDIQRLMFVFDRAYFMVQPGQKVAFYADWVATGKALREASTSGKFA